MQPGLHFAPFAGSKQTEAVSSPFLDQFARVQKMNLLPPMV